MRITALILLAGAPLLAQTSVDWQLVWGDDFNGAANSAPDPAKWTYDKGANGWGNNELENYTDSRQNSYLDGNGNLVIQALNSSGQYTSARLKSQGLFAIAYGKIEAKMKIPFGQGLWPAFWMLGANIDQVGWPKCGEIDIMENIGKEPSIVHGTIHGPGDNGAGIGGSYTLPGAGKFADDFHIYTVIWDPDKVQFQVDGNTYETVTKQQAGNMWAFDHKFFLLLNVAVGGNWPGNPNSSTTFPQKMTVDYVHVYRSASQPIAEPGGTVNAASYQTAMAPGGLGTLFGSGLAGDTYDASKLYDASAKKFMTAINGISVSVNGKFAPLTYVSAGQINFQVPSDTPITPATVDVHAIRGSTTSNGQSVTFAKIAPSAFTLLDANMTAIVTCYDSQGNMGAPIAANAPCALWGNGFGPKETPYPDGAGAPLAEDWVVGRSCKLTIDDKTAEILYCGAAPGLVIDQLNFRYPSGVSTKNKTVAATLQVGSATIALNIPSPTQ